MTPLKTRNISFSLELDQSVIEFFIGNKSQSELECTQDIILERENTIFKYADSMSFEANVKYDPKPMCHFIFANTKLDKISIKSQINNLLTKNLFRFQRIKSNESSSINCTITKIYIAGYKYDLDENLMNS
jgi:hypothetical protein